MSVAMQHPPLLSRQFRSVAGSPDYGEKKPSSPGQSSGESEGNFGALLSLMRVSCSSLCSPRPVPCGQSPVSHEEKLARHSFHVWSLDFGIMTDKTWQAKALVQVGLRHACLLLHLQLLLRLPIALIGCTEDEAVRARLAHGYDGARNIEVSELVLVARLCLQVFFLQPARSQ